MIILHLNAGRTRRGKPRQAFVIFDDLNGHVVDFVDCGCGGRRALRQRYGKRLGEEAVELGSVVTTPSEIRRFRRLADVMTRAMSPRCAALIREKPNVRSRSRPSSPSQ